MTREARVVGFVPKLGRSSRTEDPVDISTRQIGNGKPHLNLDGDISKKFNGELDANVVKADKSWPGLVKADATSAPGAAR